jgi:hypothetical protein
VISFYVLITVQALFWGVFVWFFFFQWDWSLNSGFHTHSAGTLPLEPPHLHFALVILEMGFHELFSQAGLDPQLF